MGANKPKSRFLTTVCLVDWWLKFENGSQGRRLAVAGYTSVKEPAMRLISSAPILKRYDCSNLETDDGICIILEGLLNKARTEQNGFSSDVYNHFVLGFPSYWKAYEEFPSDKAVEECHPHADKPKGNMPKPKGNETPVKGKEERSSASPQSLSTFRRSRSGRLLVPALAFWRNQRPTYNADGTITGIDEGIDTELPRKGSGSTAQRKRKAMLTP